MLSALSFSVTVAASCKQAATKPGRADFYITHFIFYAASVLV